MALVPILAQSVFMKNSIVTLHSLRDFTKSLQFNDSFDLQNAHLIHVCQCKFIMLKVITSLELPVPNRNYQGRLERKMFYSFYCRVHY